MTTLMGSQFYRRVVRSSEYMCSLLPAHRVHIDYYYVYSPASIVALHGLNGHAICSWEYHKHGTTFMWLQDSLRKACRVHGSWCMDITRMSSNMCQPAGCVHFQTRSSRDYGT